MPLFGYRCGACDTAFEALVIGAEAPSCPACGSADLQRLLSRVAAEPRVPEPAGACATCGQYGGCAAGFP